MRMGRKGAAVVAAGAVCLVGCGADGGRDESGRSPEEAMLAFAQCMRANGVDMPDPKPGERGFVVTPDMQGGGPNGPNRRQFEEADRRCRHHMEDVKPPELSAEEKEELREGSLAHARCMREHGVQVPDPTFDERGGAAIELPPDFDPNDPRVRRADEECQRHLPELAPGEEPE